MVGAKRKVSMCNGLLGSESAIWRSVKVSCRHAACVSGGSVRYVLCLCRFSACTSRSVSMCCGSVASKTG